MKTKLTDREIALKELKRAEWNLKHPDLKNWIELFLLGFNYKKNQKKKI